MSDTKEQRIVTTQAPVGGKSHQPGMTYVLPGDPGEDRFNGGKDRGKALPLMLSAGWRIFDTVKVSEGAVHYLLER